MTHQRGESVEPWWARPTMLIGRGPTGPHYLQLPLVGRHVSPYPCCTCLSFGYVGFLLHVGPWIHVRLNGTLWWVDVFCLGLRSMFPCSWSVFSPLIYQHTNIYQHSWKWSVINPYHYVDVYISCVYAGVDGLDLVLSSRQQCTVSLANMASILVLFNFNDFKSCS